MVKPNESPDSGATGQLIGYIAKQLAAQGWQATFDEAWVYVAGRSMPLSDFESDPDRAIGVLLGSLSDAAASAASAEFDPVYSRWAEACG